MWAAPLGAFGAIAFTVGKFGVGSLASLGKLLGEFYLTCVIFVIVALGPVARLCGISLIKLIRYIWEELLICVATTSSETVLPRMITKLEQLGCERSVVGLVIPTGYSFNLDGTCLYLAMASVFLAQATNTPLDLSQQIGLLLHPARDLEGRGRNSRRGLRGAGGDACGHRHHPGHQRRAGARNPSADVAGADADQFDRQRVRDHRRRQMGERAR